MKRTDKNQQSAIALKLYFSLNTAVTATDRMDDGKEMGNARLFFQDIMEI